MFSQLIWAIAIVLVSVYILIRYRCLASISIEAILLYCSRKCYALSYQIEEFYAKSQFSILLLNLQYHAQKLRLVVSKPHHQAYLQTKRRFLATFLDLLEFLVKPLAQQSQCKLVLEVDNVDVIDKIEDTLAAFKCEQWLLFPVKSAGLHLECRCRTSIIRELIFIHFCIELAGVKTIYKQQEKHYFCALKKTIINT